MVVSTGKPSQCLRKITLCNAVQRSSEVKIKFSKLELKVDFMLGVVRVLVANALGLITSTM